MKKRTNILVTGANGQLGKELKYVADLSAEITTECLIREELDITDQGAISNAFDRISPQYCINCAAYTAVDKAEQEKDNAYLVNALGPALLADECAKRNVLLIHYSTDYVYHSVTGRPILESDPCSPVSIYAKSKWQGEQNIIKSGASYLILRVSWLYSSFGNNFVKTMLRLGEERDHLKVVHDQFGSPTYGKDLATDTLRIIDVLNKSKNGINEIYNYSNTGMTTWFEFAKTIFDTASIPCKVAPIGTAEYGAAAQRPLWSVLSKEKIEKAFGLQLQAWQKSLEDCLDLLLPKD